MSSLENPFSPAAPAGYFLPPCEEPHGPSQQEISPNPSISASPLLGTALPAPKATLNLTHVCGPGKRSDSHLCRRPQRQPAGRPGPAGGRARSTPAALPSTGLSTAWSWGVADMAWGPSAMAAPSRWPWGAAQGAETGWFAHRASLTVTTSCHLGLGGGRSGGDGEPAVPRICSSLRRLSST